MSSYAFQLDLTGNSAEKIKEIRAQIEDMGGKLKEVPTKMKESFSGMPSLISSVVGGFAAFAGIRSILKLGSDMEQTNISFEVMLGNAEKAKQLVSDLQKFASVTPFTGVDTQEAAKMLLNFGIEQKDIIKDLGFLGDAAGGNAEKFKTMTYAFAQVQSTGRLMGQDLLQLINAGFNPLQEISRKTGKSMAVLKKDMESGNISAQMVQEAFISATSEGGRFYKMMEKQSQTVAGLWSTFVDKIQLQMIKLFNAIKPVLIYLMKIGSDFIDWITGTSNSAFIFKEILKFIVPTIAGIIIATKIWAAAQWILNIAMDANPIGLIIIAIAALVAIITIIIKRYNEFGAALTLVLGPLGMVINMVMSFKKHWNEIKQAFTDGGILAGIKKIGLAILDAILYPIQQLLHLIAKIPGLKVVDKGSQWIEDLRKKMGINTELDKIKAGGKTAEETAAGKFGKGGAGGLTQSAINTSLLSGASGGLGEAKIIKIDFHAPLMKVDVPGGNGMDIVAKAPMSVEMMLRIINNLSQSQGSTM